MSIKKKIRDIIAEHSAELAKGTMGYYSCERSIYFSLTGKDYVRVYIFGFGIELSLHWDNSAGSVFCVSGSINDLDGVWRRFRNAFKKCIAEQEYHRCDEEFLAKLKELYSLL